MGSISELEQKAWYRFLKLCYVFLYVICVLVVFAVAYSSLPYEYVSNWDSLIQCSNGKTYPAGENSICPKDGRLEGDSDLNARKLCAYNVVRDYAGKYKVPEEVNYNVIVVRKTRGSYKEVGQYLFWGLLVVYLIGELIRRSFLYVFAGRPFFHGISPRLG